MRIAKIAADVLDANTPPARANDTLAKSIPGVPVSALIPNGPAARAGVRSGDVILTVEGIPTPTGRAYSEAMASLTGSARLEVLRGHQVLTLVIELGPSK